MDRKAAGLIGFALPVAVGIGFNLALSPYMGGEAILPSIAIQTGLWIFLRMKLNPARPSWRVTKEEKPFEMGRFGFAGIFKSGTPIPFVCMGCNFPHDKIQCPKCGSRMKRLSS